MTDIIMPSPCQCCICWTLTNLFCFFTDRLCLFISCHMFFVMMCVLEYRHCLLHPVSESYFCQVCACLTTVALTLSREKGRKKEFWRVIVFFVLRQWSEESMDNFISISIIIIIALFVLQNKCLPLHLQKTDADKFVVQSNIETFLWHSFLLRFKTGCFLEFLLYEVLQHMNDHSFDCGVVHHMDNELAGVPPAQIA